MANDFYDESGIPSTGAALNSATMRGEFTSIGAAFDKMPGLTGNGNKVVTVNAGGTALTATAATALSGMVIGTNIQAYDADLAALAGVTSAADKVPYFTGSATAAVADFTAFGRSLVAAADAAAARAIATPFPSGTVVVFGQTSAPTGWTKGATHNDKALRVVTGTVGSGGATAFTTVFGAGKATGSTAADLAAHTHTGPSHTHTGTTGNENATHTHNLDNIVASVYQAGATGAYQNAGGALTTGTQSANHQHAFTTDAGGTGTTGSTGAGGGHTHTVSLDLQYADVIFASKD